MSIESMRCRNCGAALEAERLDRRLGIVTCAHCGGLHEFARAEDGGKGAPSPAADDARSGSSTGERPLVPEPARFEVHRGDGTLQVRWRRGRKAGAVVLAGFALVWAFAAVGAGVFFLAPVSLVLLYLALLRGVNRTTLRVDARELSVRQGPLPAGRTRRLPRADITQLLARERINRTRTGSDGRGPVRVRRSYRLQALDRAGRKRLVVGGLTSPAQALWLEREIESLLGIEDVAVAGEYRR